MSRDHKGPRQSDKRREETPSDGLEEKVLHINRTSKVVKGGRKFGFSALILVGDRAGRVGYGFAKANEVSDAIRKATEAARKNMVRIPLVEGTLPHEVRAQWDGADILMRPARKGHGLVAGSKVRAVLTLAGVTDAMGKSIGAGSAFNQVRAAFKALSTLTTREDYQRAICAGSET